MSRTVSTVQVIEAIGGPHKLAEVLEFTSPERVMNWYRGKFPANTYRAIKQICEKRGIAAPDHLWPMLPLPADWEHRICPPQGGSDS